jgi:glycosyltransferase involved in cell wall biosynthesis
VVRAGKIGVILPSRETFSLQKSGALSLCSRDFANYSRFRDLITIVGAAECEYPDVRYRRLVNWRRWWLRGRDAYAREIVRVAHDENFNILEIQNRPYTVLRVRKRLPDAQLALHLQNDPQDMTGSRTAADRRELLRHLGAVYCCSEFIRGKFLEGVDDPSDKTIVVYNGVAPANPTAPKERIFAFVGRVIPVKGAVELVRAFALAAPHLPDWRLAIAGDDPEGLLSGPRSPVAAEREALEERLVLMGQVSHAAAMALYARAEIAIVPSLWQEPFARSAIEAMSNGCALIATARGGLAEVAAGVGEIVEPADAAAFATTLRRLATDNSLRRRLQAAGKAKTNEVFDIRRVTATLDGARSRLLGAH